jgi:hypothetical protein
MNGAPTKSYPRNFVRGVCPHAPRIRIMDARLRGHDSEVNFWPITYTSVILAKARIQEICVRGSRSEPPWFGHI